VNDGNPLFSPERWRRLREVLSEADGLDAESREIILQRVAAEDADLAAAARTLLPSTSEATAHPLQHAVDRMVGAAGDAMPAQVGPFRLLHRLGAGGMGTVYLAERSGADFTQRVAIKLLDRGSAAAPRLAARERRILAALAHPNITAFVDAGSDEGRAWLAMEYIDGEPLLDACDRLALDVRERVRLFDQICAAVAHAHAHLVVHRDLKPSNVYVNRAGVAKLLDFGIAQVLDPSDDQTPATRVFTPEYAAPEQLRGERVTTATDVHALGLLLYELVSGRRLPTLAAGRSTEWSTAELARHATTSMQDPSTSRDSQRTTARLLRGDLGRIIAHTLEPRPSDRYGSVVLLREDLARWLDHRPLTLARPNLGYTVGRFVRRNRIAVAAALVAVLALLGVTAFALWQAHERAIEAQRAIDQAMRATAIQGFLSDVLNQADPNQNGGQPITPLQLIGKGEALISRFDDQPELQADVLTQVGQLYIGNSDYERAKALLDRALALSERPGMPDDVRARVLRGVAEMSIGNAKYDEGLAYAQRSLALQEADPHADAHAVAATHMHIAQALDGKGDAKETEKFLRTSLAQDRAAVGDEEKSVAEEWILLGWTLGSMSRFDEAQDAFDHGIAAYKKLYGNDGFDVGHAYNELSMVQAKAVRLDDAEKSLRETLRIYRATVGPTHRKTLSAEHGLLVLMERRGHIVEALPQREALTARASGPGLSTPRQMASHYQWLGYDYAQVGRYEEAESVLSKSLTLGSNNGSANDRISDNVARRELGLLRVTTGRYDEAENVLREALALALAQQPPDKATARALKGSLGDLLRLRGRNDEALVLLREATDFPLDTPPTSTWPPILFAERSEVELDAGDSAAAVASAQHAIDLAAKAYPADDFRRGFALYALARAQLAVARPADAEPLLREALKLRHPPFPATHPRVLEVEVALVQALDAQGRDDEARALRDEITPLLGGASPYLADLRARLNAIR
jgi:tetratricopeptide (TPR) repeat protein